MKRPPQGNKVDKSSDAMGNCGSVHERPHKKQRKVLNDSLDEGGIDSHYGAWQPFEILASAFLNKDVPRSKDICQLLDEGSTIPFLVRYRKNVIGDLCADSLRDFKEQYEEFKGVKAKVSKLIVKASAAGKMTEMIRQNLLRVQRMEEYEICAAPLKSGSKQTLAAKAKLAGLEESTIQLLNGDNIQLAKLVQIGVDGRNTLENVQTGISHIATDIICHHPETLEFVEKMQNECQTIMMASTQKVVKSKKTSEKPKESKTVDTSIKFEHYYDFSCRVKNLKSYQVMAINRGEKLKVLSVKVVIPDWFEKQFNNFCINKWRFKVCDAAKEVVDRCIEDGYKRLINPLVVRRIRSELTKNAEKDSIVLFARNLRHLLLTPPLPHKTVMAIDPGFRNGCKLAVLSSNGDVLKTEILDLHCQPNTKSKNVKQLAEIAANCKVDVIAIGNGTACRETENVVANIISDNQLHAVYTVVNEQGSSIYSCSKDAAAAYPGLSPNVISAVSIGKRLQNPLSEYVKIEPKHLGVGMYQHDIPENRLKNSLEEVVVECVSFVGVDVNCSEEHILRKVSGLTKSTAKAIMEYRQRKGVITSREELRKVKGIGEKVFQQCAGFLRITNGSNPLDVTMIHPETYECATSIIKNEGKVLNTLGSEEFRLHFAKMQKDVNIVTNLTRMYNTSVETIKLIIEGLQQELHHDLRRQYDLPQFRKGILTMDDLDEGCELTGTVSNVTAFGAFIDVGVGTNGLLHVTKMRGRNVQIGQRLKVKVGNLDKQKKRISLEFIENIL